MANAEKKQKGRPLKNQSATKDQLKEQALELIAKGHSLYQTTKILNIQKDTIFAWMSQDKDFHDKCARAREIVAEATVFECEDIENLVKTGQLEAQAGRMITSSMQWRASKLAPKKYGDKLELSGDKDNPVAIQRIERVVVDK